MEAGPLWIYIHIDIDKRVFIVFSDSLLFVYLLFVFFLIHRFIPMKFWFDTVLSSYSHSLFFLFGFSLSSYCSCLLQMVVYITVRHVISNLVRIHTKLEEAPLKSRGSLLISHREFL